MRCLHTGVCSCGCGCGCVCVCVAHSLNANLSLHAPLAPLLRSFQPHRVAIWIYWQAVVLICKGLPLHGLPSQQVKEEAAKGERLSLRGDLRERGDISCVQGRGEGKEGAAMWIWAGRWRMRGPV